MYDRVRCRMFRGTIKPWEQLFDEAAEFASSLRPEELISISHSEDGNDGVVAVWYWVDLPEGRETARASEGVEA